MNGGRFHLGPSIRQFTTPGDGRSFRNFSFLLLPFYFCLEFLPLSAPARAEIERFRLNPDESRIVAKITDPFGNVVHGALRLREGEARGDVERLQETASVRLVIDAASYNSDLGLRDQDVQKYYLEVESHPAIRLESAGIGAVERPRSGGEPWRITLRARLDLHGVRKEVTVPVRVIRRADKIVAEGGFRVNLEDFKIDVPRLLFLKTGNQVDVEFLIAGDRLP
jgi:polyisoprenoid-binding protein YceI